MRHFRSLVGKELEGYFGSPMALIFLGIFLVVTLYAFFWIEAFFASRLAEIRGLFHWMPILLIFLISALTMRQWSEEQRSGTLETLLTLPVAIPTLVLAKFVAVLLMVALAIALTLPLPITVSTLGNLDWGPVLAGYLATLLLSATYISIGLFASSRTDNQIVALMLTVILGGLLYFAGTSVATEFVSSDLAALLKAVGTDSRFQSIQRGVLDLRDLIYYLSLTGIFLALNVLSIKAIRWSRGHDRIRQREFVFSTLIILNLVATNAWLHPLRTLRVDVTQQREYSLSPTTKELLANLTEPVTIQGYFSENTHPLLAPVVPGIADMLAEYDIAGGQLVNTKILDPTTDPEIELDATQTYGIQPIPFQVAERYETAVRSSYFHLLIRHADQHVVLSVDELVDVVNARDGSTQIQLDTLEYDLTRAIKQVVYGFQSVEAVLDALNEPAKLFFLVTEATLPEQAVADMQVVVDTGTELVESAEGQFLFEVINPDTGQSRFTRDILISSYGLQPYPPSINNAQDYYFHLILEFENELHLIFPQGEISRTSVREAIDSTVQRSTPGFLRTIGVWLPQIEPTQNFMGQVQEPLTSWNRAVGILTSEFQVEFVDLESGQIGDHIDALVVVAPQRLTDNSLFAVDQYLMRGGSVIVAATHFMIAPDMLTGALSLQPTFGTLSPVLDHYGVTLEPSLVMDLQNTAFPVSVPRQVGNLTVDEYQAVDYPFFIHILEDAMAKGNPVLTNLAAVTLSYASPVVLNEEMNADRQTEILLSSSPDAWALTEIDIQEDFETYPEFGFAIPPEDERKVFPLAVSIQGQFESYFKGRPSPFLQEGEEAPAEGDLDEPSLNVIEQSPDDTRLVVVGSAEFLDDFILSLMGVLAPEQVQSNALLLQNLVDWTLEDAELLAIRARGDTIRILKPLTQQEQITIEVLNYVLALLALVAVTGIWRWRSTHQKPLVVEDAERISL